MYHNNNSVKLVTSEIFFMWRFTLASEIPFTGLEFKCYVD